MTERLIVVTDTERAEDDIRFGDSEATPADLVYRGLDIVSRITDQLEKAQAAARMTFAVMAACEKLSDIRHEAVVLLRDELGWSYGRIAEELGVGRARAAQIYKAGSGSTRSRIVDSARNVSPRIASNTAP